MGGREGRGEGRGGREKEGRDGWRESTCNYCQPMLPLQHPQALHTDQDGDQSEEAQSQLMRALYDYSGPDEDDLCFKEGDLIRVMYIGEDGWAEGMMGDKYGYVPLSWLEKVQ